MVPKRPDGRSTERVAEPVSGAGAKRALRLLAAMPLLDRLELAAIGGLCEGAAHAALRRLEGEGLAAAVRHAGTLTASTPRWLPTAAGLRRLMREERLGERELFRAHPASARSRRLLLERLDAVAVVYRLASALAGAGGIERFRWYRGHPLDAAIELVDGRTTGVLRLGATAEWTAFGERVGRLAEGARHGEARPCVLLALAAVRPGGALPAERPEARPTLPDDLDAGAAADYLLPVVLKPAEKRALDLLAGWPWIARDDSRRCLASVSYVGI